MVITWRPALGQDSGLKAESVSPLKAGILPKRETGASRFLAAHPQFDGRNVTVAILDTGVDPGAVGLLHTPDGRPKVVDVIDGTGSGDVDMRSIQRPQSGFLKGRTGRQLRLDPRWLDLTDEFHVGMKAGFELFNNELLPRYRRLRKARFDDAQKQHVNRLRRSIERSKPGAERRELETRLAQLEGLASYQDPGPVFDCVVFHDGFCWRAVVDTDEDGDLTDEKALTNYRVANEFGTFPGAELNFAVNIYEDGNLLSIVADAGDHGTHVAGIVAGYFPRRPELNGIAPGARIVSVKIGDTRLGSMETGVGLTRGIRAIVENRCDLINMSYGEASSLPNSGRLIKMLSSLVDERGVIFVAAAGNEGPGSTTVIAPATAAATIAVGAYVSPQMATVEYALRGKGGNLPYTWSSRGPALDGSRTVDFFAPGGAIAPVPQWTLRPSARMHGTSMACPNACGGVALLVSAAKQQGWRYSPELIRRCLQHSAIPFGAKTAVVPGSPGLMQVDRAFHCLRLQQGPHSAIGYRTEVAGSSNRGVYLREPDQVQKATTHLVRVRPLYPLGFRDRDKLQHRVEVRLHCTASWVTVGKHLWLDSSGGQFEIQVDPSTLAAGIHFAEVTGADVGNVNAGPLLRFPIAVFVPEQLKEGRFSARCRLTDGTVSRYCLPVPKGATWADFRIRFRGAGKKRMVLQAIQLVHDHHFRTGLHDNWFRLDGSEEKRWSIAVTGGELMEFCLGQYWSSLGATEVDWEVRFGGVVPENHHLTLRSDDPPRRITVSASLGDRRLKPRARLTTLRRSIAPERAIVRILPGLRDEALGSPAHELVLEYEITMEKRGSRTPRFPALDGYLYDSHLESLTWKLFDQGGRRIAMDDAWPEAKSIPKGKNRLHLTIRHSDPKQLVKYKQLRMSLDAALPSPISLAVSRDLHALRRGSGNADLRLRSGAQTDLFVRPPSQNQFPSVAVAGDLLIGTITYGAKVDRSVESGQRPGGFPLEVVCARPARKSALAATPGRAVTLDGLKRSRDAHDLEQLRGMGVKTKKEVFESLAADLMKRLKDPMPIRLARLHYLDHVAHRKQHLKQVVAAADAVLERIKPEEVAGALGRKGGPRRGWAAKQREVLVDTLYRKGRALGYMELPAVIARMPIADPAEHNRRFEKNFAELGRWVDTTSSRYFLLHVRRERRKGRPGAALKVLSSQMKSAAPNYWHYKKRLDLFRDLGWQHLSDYERTWKLLRFTDPPE